MVVDLLRKWNPRFRIQWRLHSIYSWKYCSCPVLWWSDLYIWEWCRTEQWNVFLFDFWLGERFYVWGGTASHWWLLKARITRDFNFSFDSALSEVISYHTLDVIIMKSPWKRTKPSYVHKEFQAVYDPKVGLIKTLLKIYWKDLGSGRFSTIMKFLFCFLKSISSNIFPFDWSSCTVHTTDSPGSWIILKMNPKRRLMDSQLLSAFF